MLNSSFPLENKNFMNKKASTINLFDAKNARMPKKHEWMVEVAVVVEVTEIFVVEEVGAVESATHFKMVIATKDHNVDSVTKVEGVVAVAEAAGAVVEEEVAVEVVAMVTETAEEEEEATETETVEAEEVAEEVCAMHSRKEIVPEEVHADSVTTRLSPPFISISHIERYDERKNKC